MFLRWLWIGALLTMTALVTGCYLFVLVEMFDPKEYPAHIDPSVFAFAAVVAAFVALAVWLTPAKDTKTAEGFLRLFSYGLSALVALLAAYSAVLAWSGDVHRFAYQTMPGHVFTYQALLACSPLAVVALLIILVVKTMPTTDRTESSESATSERVR